LKTTRIMTQGAIAVVWLSLQAACGGSAPAPASPSAEPAPPSAAGAASKAPESVAQPSFTPRMDVTESPAAPPPPPPAPPAPGEEKGVTAALRGSRSELARAERDLEASLSDCRSACHALASMERATGHLCDMASDHEDRRTCEDAKTKVLAARDRIRSSCGSCPDGPTLDRTAPVPSRP
jgi:hypothetical protein